MSDPAESPTGKPASRDSSPQIAQTSVRQTASIQSPLLPPQLLHEYGELIANAPERFMTMLENEHANRRHLERWRTVGPFALLAMVICAGVYLGGWVGGSVIGAVTAIGAWLYRPTRKGRR